MPFFVEGELFEGLFVGEVVDLLEDGGAGEGVEFLGGPAHVFGEEGCDDIDGDAWEDVFAKGPGPGLEEEFFPFRSEVLPEIEEDPLVVILVIYHALLPIAS